MLPCPPSWFRRQSSRLFPSLVFRVRVARGYGPLGRAPPACGAWHVPPRLAAFLQELTGSHVACGLDRWPWHHSPYSTTAKAVTGLMSIKLGSSSKANTTAMRLPVDVVPKTIG